MYKSENINELAMALSKAQGKIQPALRDKANPFFKSRYADLASVWEACRDSLSENGLAVLQTIEGKTADSIMLVTTLVHSSGQWMRGEMPVVTNKLDPQGLGSAITYYRRYSLAAMIGVAPDDDDDAEVAQNRKGSAIKPPPIPINMDEAFNKIVASADKEKMSQYVKQAAEHYKKNEEFVKSVAIDDPTKFMSNYAKWMELNSAKAM